jgi:hypothetical protein
MLSFRASGESCLGEMNLSENQKSIDQPDARGVKLRGERIKQPAGTSAFICR